MASRAGTATLRDEALLVPEAGDVLRADVVVVGSGMGGGTLAWALRDSGLSVLILERGGFLPLEPQNGDAEEVFVRGRYRTEGSWWDERAGKPFRPGSYSWVGGNSKLYAASAPRFRAEDFGIIEHREGISPAWPFSYDELEPYYGRAEVLYGVRGAASEDPTDPPRSTPYPFPALEHEPEVERLAASLRAQGLHPFHMPNAMDLSTPEQRMAESTAAGGPSPGWRKNDAEKCAVRPALESPDVQMVVHADVEELVPSADGGRVQRALVSSYGRRFTVEADQFVVAAGAVQTAALLLRSTQRSPQGLANASGLVGRRYMGHSASVVMGVHPTRRNDTAWQKTLGMNDWYLAGADTPYPLGNVQMMGKLRPAMVSGARPWAPRSVLAAMTGRSMDLHLLSEDLPRDDNRVLVSGNRLAISWSPSNVESHRELVRRTRRFLRRAGYPLVLAERMGIAYNSHQCGTATAGDDGATSVVDAQCRSHDVSNLWVADSSIFPSSAAVNPALTIAANALRVAEHVGVALGGAA